MTFISIFSIIQSWRSMPATWEYQHAILCIIRQEINSSMVIYSFCAYITTGQSGRSSEHRTQNHPEPAVYEIVLLVIQEELKTNYGEFWNNDLNKFVLCENDALLPSNWDRESLATMRQNADWFASSSPRY